MPKPLLSSKTPLSPIVQQAYRRLADIYRQIPRAEITRWASDTSWMGEDAPDYLSKGGHSCVAFMERHVCVQLDNALIPLTDLPTEPHATTGRSFADFWAWQKSVIIEMLETDAAGRRKHNLAVLCWPRGESKSWIVVNACLWLLATHADQRIIYSAQTLGQSDYVHLQETKRLLETSRTLPHLIPPGNVTANEIRLTKGPRAVVAGFIRGVSSMHGILSNRSAMTASEFAQSRSPWVFFTQLWHSGRNQPNDICFIDSTVSDENHLLYLWYKKSIGVNPPENVFFSYRTSKLGQPEDYRHPRMDALQLETYRTSTPFGFDEYFLNQWGAGRTGFVSALNLKALDVVAIDGKRDNAAIIAALKRCQELELAILDAAREGREHFDQTIELEAIESRFTTLSQIVGPGVDGEIPSIEVITKLMDFYDSEPSVILGYDGSDAEIDAEGNTKTARSRSIVLLLLKFNPGSRSASYHSPIRENPRWQYVVLSVFVTNKTSVSDSRVLCDQINDQLGVNTIGAEKYNSGELPQWAGNKGVKIEIISPTAEYKKSIFTLMLKLIETQQIKIPVLPTKGSKQTDDIIREELSSFTVTETKTGKYVFQGKEKGSKAKDAIQDDSIFALAAALHACQKQSLNCLDESIVGIINNPKRQFWGSVYDENGVFVAGRNFAADDGIPRMGYRYIHDPHEGEEI